MEASQGAPAGPGFRLKCRTRLTNAVVLLNPFVLRVAKVEWCLLPQALNDCLEFLIKLADLLNLALQRFNLVRAAALFHPVVKHPACVCVCMCVCACACELCL